jgi:hypothetical protein
MPTQQTWTEDAKIKFILQLSRDQIRALQANDFPTFQRILTAKGAVIGSLRPGNAMAEREPAVRAMLKQIKDSEHEAERLLTKQLGSIQDRLSDIKRAKQARRAYRKIERKLPKFVPTTETPLMFDLRA